MADKPIPCPYCGGPAHRITPMGFWEKETGYSPKGVRYVCGKLYLDPPEHCPGRETFYGDDAEEKALAAWNTRAAPDMPPQETSAATDHTTVVARLLAACCGTPAQIPWPHRLLHDAVALIEAQASELERLRADRDTWVKNDVARDADFATLKAERDTLRQTSCEASLLSALPKYDVCLTINHNDHKSVYATVLQYLTHMSIGYGGTNGADPYSADEWVSREDFDVSVATGELWSIQWYPSTPVGFGKVYGSTLANALRKATEK